MKHQDTSEESQIDILFLLLPIFLFYKYRVNQISIDAKEWTKIRAGWWRRASIIVLASLTIPIWGMYSLKNLISEKYVSGIMLFTLFSIAQIPLAKLYCFYKMNELVKQNAKGNLDPNTSYALKKARFIHGCEYSEKRFSKIWSLAPNNAIGVHVEPYDRPLPLLGEPKISDGELDKVVKDSFAIFPLNKMSPDHHLVIGQTGSGKTTLIAQMMKAALNNSWKVVLLDLKGDPTDIQKLAHLEEDQSKVRIFPNHVFDFWQGTSNEIAERIISFFPTESEPYYLNRNANAIHSVVSRSGLSNPKSVEELLNRIRRGLMLAQTQSDVSFFSQKERGHEIGELIANDVSIYLDPIRNLEQKTPYKFHWQDNWNLGIFSLDGFEPSALRIADALLHDFASWIFSDARAESKAPILLIIDEASAFHALPRVPILSALIQRARSAQVSLVFASQSLSAFKDEKENLLHSGAIRWLGNSTEVEDMVEAAGTRSVVESGFQFDELAYTGMVTHRGQKEFKIDPDFVKELRTFHWFVSSRGKVSSVFIPPITWS